MASIYNHTQINMEGPDDSKWKQKYGTVSAETVRAIRQGVIDVEIGQCTHFNDLGTFTLGAIEELARRPLTRLSLRGCSLAAPDVRPLSTMTTLVFLNLRTNYLYFRPEQHRFRGSSAALCAVDTHITTPR